MVTKHILYISRREAPLWTRLSFTYGCNIFFYFGLFLKKTLHRKLYKYTTLALFFWHIFYLYSFYLKTRLLILTNGFCVIISTHSLFSVCQAYIHRGALLQKNTLGASENTANIYCNCVHLYWEGCVICSIYLR